MQSVLNCSIISIGKLAKRFSKCIFISDRILAYSGFNFVSVLMLQGKTATLQSHWLNYECFNKKREGKTGINFEWLAPLDTSTVLQKFFFKVWRMEAMEITQTAGKHVGVASQCNKSRVTRLGGTTAGVSGVVARRVWRYFWTVPVYSSLNQNKNTAAARCWVTIGVAAARRPDWSPPSAPGRASER